MDGLSLHYYVHPEGWLIKGSATDFDEKAWYKTMSKALYMDKLIRNHSAIMDEYDPDKRIGMVVDEWGTWFNVEPGTNPGFLYQQSTMRDALVAGITLNIFNKHCDRVKMANLAQMVNVLQAVIHTDKEKMMVTPTYHVFRMYKKHQDAELIESSLSGVEMIGLEDEHMVPNLFESVSMSKDGRIQVTLNNLSVTDSYNVEAVVVDGKVKSVTGTILTNDMRAYNTFDNPNNVCSKEFDGYKITDNGVSINIPACSVLHLELEI